MAVDGKIPQIEAFDLDDSGSQRPFQDTLAQR
jgi:hypothetical protein